MPFYTYMCVNCQLIELEKRMTEDDFKNCPYCGCEIQRVFYPTQSIWKTDGAFSKTNHKE